MGQFGIGQAVTRSEDARFLSGHGCYTDDMVREGQAYAFVVRSPHAHARVNAIDTTAARTAPGVYGVFTVDDLKSAGIGTIPCLYALEQKDGAPLVTPPRPLLADGVVRHVGEPVAFIVAGSVDEAKDAAELVEIDYDPLPAVVDTEGASDPEAPQVWAEAPNNTCFVWEAGDVSATNNAFARARHIIELRLVNNRLVANPMEGRAALGEYAEDRFTLHTPSQGPHSIQRQLAKSIFRLPRESFRVVTPDVGGGFGMKIFLYPEQPLVLFSARSLGRPVKWAAERSSDGFLSDNQGRDHVSHAELALDKEGKFLGLRVHTYANLGAYLSNFAPFIPTESYVSVLSGAYEIPAVHLEVTGVFTNTVPVDAYRGAGRPEAIYLIERLVDVAARTCCFDPAELRRRNFIPAKAMPCTRRPIMPPN